VARSTASRPGRTLAGLALIVLVLAGTLAAAVTWSNASLKPKLALDLAGGTQIILEPVVAPGQGEVTDQTIADAIAIIRQRVNSSGVSEAEVSSQGGRNIVVELPGKPEEQKQARELVRKSAQMRFRPVLVEAPSAPAGMPTEGGAATPAPSATPSDGASPAPSGQPTVAPAPTESTNGRAVPKALTQGTPAPTPTDSAATPAPTPTGPSDLAWITPEVQQQFAAMDCSDPAAYAAQLQEDVTKPLVTCSEDGTLKYVLGPVEVEGVDIDSASAGLAQTAQGVTTGQWVVQLKFDGEGTKAFRETTERLVTMQPPQNQFAIVLDGLVVSAPRVNEPITTGDAQISGGFTQDTATTLANQLKFGALPISFKVQTEDQISALLGAEQLQRGLLAGLIGLLLVVVYSLLQYRALGLVTVASLGIAALLTYLAIALLSWYQGYRLSLPGVAGVIVAIGITADSFIVFFERVRDEVREGRSLVAAVENGWRRSRRTIMVSDAVSLLSAVVLYVLAVGGVRGFAFTLGLTTLIDLLVVVMFTHPMVALLARTKFFGGGHKLSGFDAAHLGRTVAYVGRGRVRVREGAKSARGEQPARQTIAERKAAAARARAEGSDAGEAGNDVQDRPDDEHATTSPAKES
jgi:preprotein translocase subunit SecD